MTYFYDFRRWYLFELQYLAKSHFFHQKYLSWNSRKKKNKTNQLTIFNLPPPTNIDTKKVDIQDEASDKYVFIIALCWPSPTAKAELKDGLNSKIKVKKKAKNNSQSVLKNSPNKQTRIECQS